MGCQETNIESIIGYIALSFELIHRFPQLYKLYKTKRGNDISELMIITSILSSSLYVVYAILRTDNIILVGSIVPIIQDIVMIIMMRTYRKQISPIDYLIII